MLCSAVENSGAIPSDLVLNINVLVAAPEPGMAMHVGTHKRHHPAS